MLSEFQHAAAASLLCTAAAVAQPASLPLNLLFLGDSLTEGVPHLHGETETYPFMVSQKFAGSTYVKLGYRGQPTDYLLTHLDAFLFGLLKIPDYRNVLVVWGGTNDCALEPIDCAQPAYTRLVLIAKAAHAAGWQVIAVTMIARANWFIDNDHKLAFPANQAKLNSLILNSTEFDATADPSPVLTDPTDYALYSDGTHLWPAGYQVVADSVVKAIRGLK